MQQQQKQSGADDPLTVVVSFTHHSNVFALSPELVLAHEAQLRPGAESPLLQQYVVCQDVAFNDEDEEGDGDRNDPPIFIGRVVRVTPASAAPRGFTLSASWCADLQQRLTRAVALRLASAEDLSALATLREDGGAKMEAALQSLMSEREDAVVAMLAAVMPSDEAAAVARLLPDFRLVGIEVGSRWRVLLRRRIRDDGSDDDGSKPATDSSVFGPMRRFAQQLCERAVGFDADILVFTIGVGSDHIAVTSVQGPCFRQLDEAETREEHAVLAARLRGAPAASASAPPPPPPAPPAQPLLMFPSAVGEGDVAAAPPLSVAASAVAPIVAAKRDSGADASASAGSGRSSASGSKPTTPGSFTVTSRAAANSNCQPPPPPPPPPPLSLWHSATSTGGGMVPPPPVIGLSTANDASRQQHSKKSPNWEADDDDDDDARMLRSLQFVDNGIDNERELQKQSRAGFDHSTNTNATTSAGASAGAALPAPRAGDLNVHAKAFNSRGGEGGAVRGEFNANAPVFVPGGAGAVDPLRSIIAAAEIAAGTAPTKNEGRLNLSYKPGTGRPMLSLVNSAPFTPSASSSTTAASAAANSSTIIASAPYVDASEGGARHYLQQGSGLYPSAMHAASRPGAGATSSSSFAALVGAQQQQQHHHHHAHFSPRTIPGSVFLCAQSLAALYGIKEHLSQERIFNTNKCAAVRAALRSSGGREGSSDDEDGGGGGGGDANHGHDDKDDRSTARRILGTALGSLANLFHLHSTFRGHLALLRSVRVCFVQFRYRVDCFWCIDPQGATLGSWVLVDGDRGVDCGTVSRLCGHVVLSPEERAEIDAAARAEAQEVRQRLRDASNDAKSVTLRYILPQHPLAATPADPPPPGLVYNLTEFIPRPRRGQCVLRLATAAEVRWTVDIARAEAELVLAEVKRCGALLAEWKKQPEQLRHFQRSGDWDWQAMGPPSSEHRTDVDLMHFVDAEFQMDMEKLALYFRVDEERKAQQDAELEALLIAGGNAALVQQRHRDTGASAHGHRLKFVALASWLNKMYKCRVWLHDLDREPADSGVEQMPVRSLFPPPAPITAATTIRGRLGRAQQNNGGFWPANDESGDPLTSGGGGGGAAHFGQFGVASSQRGGGGLRGRRGGGVAPQHADPMPARAGGRGGRGGGGGSNGGAPAFHGARMPVSSRGATVWSNEEDDVPRHRQHQFAPTAQGRSWSALAQPETSGFHVSAAASASSTNSSAAPPAPVAPAAKVPPGVPVFGQFQFKKG